MSSDEILTRKEIAKHLKIPVRTIDYLVNTGQIPFSRIGQRTVRFQKSRIDEYLKQREGVPFSVNRGSSECRED
jgi:excisionase family DNA binding protein